MDGGCVMMVDGFVTTKQYYSHHYVAKDQEILTQKRNIDDPVEKEQYVKIVDTASFIKVAQNEFLCSEF